jgi:serine/threonine-protein kinase
MPAVLVAMVALAASLYFATRTGAKPVARQPEAPAALAKAIAMKGGEMVLVEAGPFLAGEKKEPDTLPAFYIDKTEVSNAAYAQFCAETKRTLPKGFAADQPQYPVVNVLILDARAFAEWAGKRLPKGREWEKAAAGQRRQRQTAAGYRSVQRRQPLWSAQYVGQRVGTGRSDEPAG